MAKLTALEKIADRCTVANNAATRYRSTAKDEPKNVKAANAAGYAEGKVAAYNEAHAIMKAELQRLRNMWQNGMIITASDFEIGD